MTLHSLASYNTNPESIWSRHQAPAEATWGGDGTP